MTEQASEMTESPGLLLVVADGLTRSQRQGNSCVSCRKLFPRPSVPAGITPAGEVLMRCPDCVVVPAGDARPPAAAGRLAPRRGSAPAAPGGPGGGAASPAIPGAARS